jgi:PKD repeat protein
MRYFSLLFLSLLVILAGCNKDTPTTNSEQPTITGFTPAEVSRGSQNISGHILGTNFVGIVVVNLGPGITIKDTVLKSSTEIVVKFSVNPGAASGTQTITVVTSAGQATNSAALSIKDNREPTAAFSMDPPSGAKGTVFNFDASASTDPDGTIHAYDWNFGDNQTGTGKTVTHSYSSAGNFKVVLKVTDNNQATATSEKSVDIKNSFPPVAHMTITPPSGDASTSFRFDGSSSTDSDGRIVKWVWDFGDKTSSQGKVVNHKYPRSDTFPVTLTVVDSDGLEGVANKDVDIKGVPPIAQFTTSPSSGDTSTTFRFDASGSRDPDGSIASYSWKFGGGSKYSGKTIARKFPEDGSYSVVLTVTDNDGMTDTAEKRDIEIGGGGGGGGGGNPDLCTGSNYDGQQFRVVSVSGHVITANATFDTCPGRCPEIRRDAPGILEFVGDAKSFHGNQVTYDPGSLPEKTAPVVGETLRMIWRRCD